MNIKVNSARSIIVRAQGRNGEVALGCGGAQYRKIDTQMKQFLSNEIDRNCVIILKELKRKMRAELPDKPNVSDSQISRILDGMFNNTTIDEKFFKSKV